MAQMTRTWKANQFGGGWFRGRLDVPEPRPLPLYRPSKLLLGLVGVGTFGRTECLLEFRIAGFHDVFFRGFADTGQFDPAVVTEAEIEPAIGHARE